MIIPDHISLLDLSAAFERTLDPADRARLGAYYTPLDNVRLLVEPVLMQPLRREWAAVEQKAAQLIIESGLKPLASLETLRAQILHRVRTITVLDPACGAGNFLVVALQTLMDFEREILAHPVWAGLPEEMPQVHPRQMFGTEKDLAAAELTRQILGAIAAGFANTVLPFPADNIRCMDAIVGISSEGAPYHPAWQSADIILSNPPFLGSRKLRPQLGSAYAEALQTLYADSFGSRTPDLVCYWFERARRQLAAGQAQRVGLLATNSIRGGTNRRVLEHIARTGRIFLAWSDRAWRQNGVSVSMAAIGFDRGDETITLLDGQPVAHINPDLTTGVDLTSVRLLPENQRLAFQGVNKRGAFDLSDAEARHMLNSDPATREVVEPVWNGDDITNRPRNRWIIDFGTRSLDEARRYALPFAYVLRHVKPARAKTNQPSARQRWWQHWNVRPEMRQALAPLSRYIATPATAKHRVFVWLSRDIHPDHALIVFAREDDYFFGVLHSRVHEFWALRLGTSLEDRPRYTPTSVFETFPFPWSPGAEDTASPAYAAIARAAKALHEERTVWLNPMDKDAPLRQRTLTHLYNALDVFREALPDKGLKPLARTSRVSEDALAFAPHLDALHRALDEAVCAAYGWTPDALDDEQDMLSRLLALNHQRSEQ